MAELPTDVDEWLADRDRTPLGEGRILRYQYVGAGKSRDLDVTLEVDADGSVVGAEGIGWIKRRSLRAFASRLQSLGPYESPPEAVRGGQYEIATVMRDDEVYQVVFENVDKRPLEILREAAEDLR